MAASSATRPSPSALFAVSPRSPPRPPPPQRIKIKSHPTFLKPLRTSTVKSVDVSKEDKQEEQSVDISKEEKQEEIPADKRRLEEKFAVVNTGLYECRSCGYTYDETAGDPSYPIPPGLPFDKLPDDWRCSTCGASQSFFQSKSMEIAGFAQNQQFGLGGNTLTSGQKALLIYGSLLFGFALFLSGYFLQ